MKTFNNVVTYTVLSVLMFIYAVWHVCIINSWNMMSQ